MQVGGCRGEAEGKGRGGGEGGCQRNIAPLHNQGRSLAPSPQPLPPHPIYLLVRLQRCRPVCHDLLGCLHGAGELL
jgi:hypothetical protein